MCCAPLNGVNANANNNINSSTAFAGGLLRMMGQNHRMARLFSPYLEFDNINNNQPNDGSSNANSGLPPNAPPDHFW